MPKSFYEPHLLFCTKERGCCDKGGDILRKHAKRQLKALGLRGGKVNSVACLDRCELGPVFVIYPEAVWYRADTIEDIDEILSEHIVHGRPVARLRLPDRDQPQRLPPRQTECL